MNLPIGGFTLLLLFLFHRGQYTKDAKLAAYLKQIDVAGTIMLAASTSSILVSLEGVDGRPR